MKNIKFGGYKIVFNQFWANVRFGCDAWQVWHDEIGFVSSHSSLAEALGEVRNG